MAAADRGIKMVVLAFWTAGQFFIPKAFVLLVFAGIWALMHGSSDIIRAFVLRGLPEPAESTAMAPPVRDIERGAGRAAAP